MPPPPIKAKPREALVIDESLVDWIVLPELAGSFVGRLESMSEREVRDAFERGIVPHAVLYPTFSFSSPLWPDVRAMSMPLERDLSPPPAERVTTTSSSSSSRKSGRKIAAAPLARPMSPPPPVLPPVPMRPIHCCDRLERSCGWPRSAEFRMRVVLTRFDYLSEKDEETRRFLARRLRDAERIRSGLIATLGTGT